MPMSLTNCELCGKICEASEGPCGEHRKTYCGCDRTYNKGNEMKWDYDGEGEWDTESHKHDEDGSSLIWRIQVCDDGSFVVNASDVELTTHNGSFATLQLAKDFCERIEGNVIVTSAEPGKPDCLVIDKPRTPTAEHVEVISAWFTKALAHPGARVIGKIDGQ